LEHDSLKVKHPTKGASYIPVTVDSEKILIASGIGRTIAIFECEYLINGSRPHVNNIGFHESDEKPSPSLASDAIHLYKGVNRPLEDKGVDQGIYIYIYRPVFIYEYIPSMVCCAKRVLSPDKAVFAVYVQFNSDMSDGKILNWEWLASKDNDKPNEYENRYNEEIW